MKKMHIRIRKDGSTEIRVEGAVGDDCESFTKAFEKAVGKVAKREYTDAYYADRSRIDEQVDLQR